MTQHVTMMILVGIGGAAGSMSRYGVGLLLQRTLTVIPFGTMAANILGCFIIGIITAVAGRGGVSPEVRLALATGFCGGFTTMSSMVYESAGMLRTGEYGMALAYAGGTFILSMAAFFAGDALVRCLIR